MHDLIIPLLGFALFATGTTHSGLAVLRNDNPKNFAVEQQTNLREARSDIRRLREG